MNAFYYGRHWILFICLCTNLKVLGGEFTPPVAVDDKTTAVFGKPITFSVSTNDYSPDHYAKLDLTSIDLDPTTPGIQNTFAVADQGTFNIDTTGLLTFNPAPDFTGTTTISYIIADNRSVYSKPARITIVIGPDTRSDSTTTTFNHSISITDITRNDVDAEGINKSSIDLNPDIAGQQRTFKNPQGTFSVDGTGKTTFTPVKGFNGNAFASYTVKDNKGINSEATRIAVTVAANITPIAVNDTLYTSYVTSASTNILINDSDADGTLDPASIDLDPSTPGIQTTYTISEEGTFTVDNTGKLTFTPFVDFTSFATITYTVNDDWGETSNTATIITYVGPDAFDDIATSIYNQIYIFDDITDNDRDVDGINKNSIDLNPSTSGMQSNQPALGGSFSLEPDGRIIFTPTPGFVGVVSISYIERDIFGAPSDIAKIRVNVPHNVTPVTKADTALTAYLTPVTKNLLDNDSDADGTLDKSTIDLSPGTIGIQNILNQPGKGTFIADTSGNVTFTPVINFTGTAIATYNVQDNWGLYSNTSNFIVYVGPDAVNDTANTYFNQTYTFTDISSNDIDVDGIDQNSIDLNPYIPGVQNNISTGQGSFTLSTNGTVIFQPITGFTGTASTPYVEKDAKGAPSDTAFIIVNINHNIAPVANDDSATTLKGTSVSLNILTNDSDIDGQLVPSTIDLNPSLPGIQQVFPIIGEGTFYYVDTAFNNGTVVFIPEPNFLGTSQAHYIVQDNYFAYSNIASIKIKVIEPLVNLAFCDGVPGTNLLREGNFGTGTTVQGQALSNGTTAYLFTDLTPTQPQEGAYTITKNTLNSRNIWAKLPADHTGNGGYMMVVNANKIQSLVYKKQITGLCPNTVYEFSAYVQNILTACDPSGLDNGKSAPDVPCLLPGISFMINGEVVHSTDPIPYTGQWQKIGFTFNPGNLSTIEIALTNNLPGGLGNDFALDDIYFGACLPNITYVAGNDGGFCAGQIVKFSATVTDSKNIYTNYLWQTSDDGTTWTEVTGSRGSVSPATQTPLVYQVNLNLGTYSTALNEKKYRLVVASRPEGLDNTCSYAGNAITIHENTTPSNAGLNRILACNRGILQDSTYLNATGTGYWTLNAATQALGIQLADSTNPKTLVKGFTKGHLYSFTWIANGACPATATITTPAICNLPPIANNDSISTPHLTPVTVNVLTNDTDTDGSINPNTLDLNLIQSQIQNTITITGEGTYTADNSGNITFSPADGFTAVSHIYYQVYDNSNEYSEPAKLTVAVGPDARDDIISTAFNTPVTITNITANDIDVDGILSGSVDLNPNLAGIQNSYTIAAGTFTITMGGTVLFTPSASFTGQVIADYTDKDNKGISSDIAHIIITVAAPIILPIARDDKMSVPYGSTVTINILENDNDPDGTIDPTSVALQLNNISDRLEAVSPGKGTIALDDLGNLSFTPSEGFTSTLTIPYTVKDNQGNESNVARIAIGVGPDATDDIKEGKAKQPITFNDITTNDLDAQGINKASIDLDLLSDGIQTSMTLVGKGIFENQGEGKIVFTPEKTFSGEARIPYRETDTDGNLSDQAEIIAVINAPLPPNVFIPNGFSPNGDGVNDYFVITGLEEFDASIYIYNRWGNMVFGTQHYKNNWDGSLNKTQDSGQGTKINVWGTDDAVPDGTYFFIIEFSDQRIQKQKGYLVVSR